MQKIMSTIGKSSWFQVLSVLLIPLVFGAYIFSYHFTWSLVGALRQDLTTIAVGAKTDVITQLKSINERLRSIEEHLRKEKKGE